ncbi:hypothetical protein ACQPZJ_14530 [Actinoplanes sp. CA-054009]
MAADLCWDDVQKLFDPGLMGSLPDACVPQTSVADWQALLDLVVARGWRFEYSEGDTALPLPTASAILTREPGSEYPALRVWPYPHLLMIFWFSGADEIDFDLDLREIQDQERLDEFCEFLRAVGRHLDKPVLMAHEMGNPAEHPVLGFLPDTDRVVVIDPASSVKP